MLGSLRLYGLTIVAMATIMLAALTAAVAEESNGFVRDANGIEYFTFNIDEEALSGAPDFSWLNRPITSHDRLFVKNGHFYRVGPDEIAGTDDDERVRLYGANLSFAANFPAPEEAPAMAKRLRKLGFNAVRLHHLDSQPSDETDPPRSLLTTGPYPTLNPEAVERLRVFIEALAAEGLYVNLNLRVGYRFRPEIDGLPPLDNGMQQPASIGTPIHVYDPELIKRQEEYAQAIIQALGLSKNPALAMVELNNESSLVAAWVGDAWWGDTWRNAIPSEYAPILQAAWSDWILEKYGTLEAACKAWNNCDDYAITALPQASLRGYTSATPGLAERIQSKIRELIREQQALADNYEARSPEEQYIYDFFAFLSEMDKRYFERMAQVVRRETHPLMPITGTQMGYGGVLNFDSQQQLDYIDNHIYIGHPVYASGNPWLSEDWRVPNTSSSGGGIQQLLNQSLRRDQAKPFVVSEYNQVFPTPSGSEILPLMAAVAALQDWDGLFFFNYDDSLETKQAPWYFSLSGDWGKYAMTGPSAWLFRNSIVPALEAEIALPLGQQERYALAAQGHIRNEILENHVQRVHGLSPTIMWQARVGQEVRDDNPQKVVTVESKLETATPTGSLLLNEKAGFTQLQTAGIAGYFGLLQPQQRLALGPLQLQSNSHAVMPVQALLSPLDNDNLESSQHLLLTLGSDTVGTHQVDNVLRPKAYKSYPDKSGWLTLEPEPNAKGPSALLAAQAPAWMRRQDISIQLPDNGKNIAIYPLDARGQRLAPLESQWFTRDSQGQLWVQLQGTSKLASPWYEIIYHDSQ